METVRRVTVAAEVAENETDSAARPDVADSESPKLRKSSADIGNGGNAGRGTLLHDVSGWVGGSIEDY